MKAPAQGRGRRRSALAGIASFFRQLSLFDPVPQAEAALAPPPPSVPVRRAPEPLPALPATDQAPRPDRVPSFAEMCAGPYAHIEVVTRNRLWESWRVAWRRRNESLRLDIPLILEDAPGNVKEGVLEWAVLVTRRNGRRDPILRARRAELESLIRDHLRAPVGEGKPVGRAAGLRLERNRRRMESLEPKGGFHDLDEVFRAINARYFEGRLQARLTWSARLGGLSTHTISQDGEGAAYHLISISRGYDTPGVTAEILGGVVYHECLHIVIPPRREGGRRVVHGPDFRKREREYDHYEVWRRWHRDGLPKALRLLKRA